MPEILTESFCERCGTRYTFESARPHVRLQGVKVLSRGFKNFVLSDGTTMDEAMASARSETDREVTAHQLDAFHKTFNFCMSCRQYTCPNCWNEAEARCLTCAPHLGHEILPAPFPDLAPNGRMVVDPGPILSNGLNGPNRTHGTNGTGAATTAQPDIWMVPGATADPATTYDDIDAVARFAMLTGTGASIAAEPAVDAEPEVNTEASMATEAVVEAEPVVEIAPTVPVEPPVAVAPDASADAEMDPESVARLAAFASAEPVDAPATAEPNLRIAIGDMAAAQTGGLLRRFRPGQNLDDELDAYERRQASPPPADIAVEPEAVAAAEVFAESRVEAAAVEPEVIEPEAFAESLVEAPAIAEPLPEMVAAPEQLVEIEVFAESPAEPEPIVNDVIPQPTWRMIAPDPTPILPAEPTTPIPAAATSADPTAEPQWPAPPGWLGGAPTNGLPFLNRPVAPQGGIEALWAESSREVVTAPLDANKPVVGGIQPCISCGLSLSANARFCRRCGTLQGS